VSAGSSDLEGLHFLTAGLYVNHLTGLDPKRGTIYKLAVDQDVTVDDHLPGLRGCARNASAQHQSIEAHFQELDQVFTGQALRFAGLFEYPAKLSFANTVLSPQTLFLTQPNGIVTIGFALGATVLTGSIRALF
jgi:hypothetical protein